MIHFNQLSNFERFAKNLVEGSLARFIRRDRDLQSLALYLLQSADSSEKDGTLADEYEIRINSALFEEIMGSQELYINNLTELLERYSHEMGKPFSGEVSITFVDDDKLAQAEFNITSTHSASRVNPTRQIPLVKKTQRIDAISEIEAFLIVSGKRHVPVSQAVLNIGRHLDNDIVIDSSSVSRHHAQIKFRYGHFIIHNLSGGVGTLVNDHPITESILKPGDVIDLGGIKLIYGEGAEKVDGKSIWNDDEGNTEPLSGIGSS